MDNPENIPDNQVAPEGALFNRRNVVRTGVLAASVLATGYMYRRLNRVGVGGADTAELEGLVKAPPVGDSGFNVDETPTPMKSVTGYNNFYEFSTDKESVAEAGKGFKSDNWRVSVEGLCRKPKEFDLDDLLRISPPEERIYRFRCVEAWSMVIPWAGYSLSRLLERVEPLGSAKYVAFESLYDPNRMPNQKTKVLDWPYTEGLRMDEAMHPLALLATGVYGRKLPPQNGEPVRMVIPWKYGFKGAKSIVKITLSEEQPRTTWGTLAPSEYGFYANVNPTVDHPRWSQATEQRIGESGRRQTLMFNGYEKQVASLYTGMDLRKNY